MPYDVKGSNTVNHVLKATGAFSMMPRSWCMIGPLQMEGTQLDLINQEPQHQSPVDDSLRDYSGSAAAISRAGDPGQLPRSL
jgi:hypothetical protein